MANSKTKKVRQPKTASEKLKVVEKKAEPKVEKVKPESNPRAQVTLVGCASLSRHGRNYTKDVAFIVNGQDKINYYETDPRFEVLKLK